MYIGLDCNLSWPKPSYLGLKQKQRQGMEKLYWWIQKESSSTVINFSHANPVLVELNCTTQIKYLNWYASDQWVLVDIVHSFICLFIFEFNEKAADASHNLDQQHYGLSQKSQIMTDSAGKWGEGWIDDGPQNFYMKNKLIMSPEGQINVD